MAISQPVEAIDKDNLAVSASRQDAGLSSFERALFAMDGAPFDAVTRIAIGYGTGSVWGSLRSFGVPEWLLPPAFLAVLLGLRLGPAVLRKLLPLSYVVKGMWAERRRLAKLYDSYQWRKLFWFGLGFAVYAALTSDRSSVLLGMTVIILIAGALGQIVWRRRKAQIPSEAFTVVVAATRRGAA